MSLSGTSNLDPVLVRQLKRAGALESDKPPSIEAWTKFLSAVNDHYRHLNEDRALLTRSMELSTNEMEQLRKRVERQRDQLSSIVDAIGEALGLFGGIVKHDPSGTDVTAGLEFAKREFSTRLERIFGEESSGDSTQVSGIRTNLVQLADQLIRLISETAERASIKKELEVAKAVQSLLVPTEDVIEKPFMRIAGLFQPASECGGDWWAVYDLPDERVLTLVGDVTGHGISSAIITGAAKAACDLACHMTKGRISPSELLALMNSAIHQTARRQIMMTCTAALFDPRAGSLTIANAGHHFPYLVRDGQLRQLLVHGQPLGAAPDSLFESTTLPFSANDVLVWFTDGVIESENEYGEQFSDRRLRAVCQRAAPLGARGVRDAVVEAMRAFQKDTVASDDVTLVVAAMK